MMDSFFVGSTQRRGRRTSRNGAPPTVNLIPKAAVSTAGTAASTIDYRPVSPHTASYAGGDARKSLVAYIDADNYSLESSVRSGRGGSGARHRRSGSGAGKSGSQPATASMSANQRPSEAGFFSSIWALGRVVYVTAVEGSKEVVNDVATLAAGFSRERKTYAQSIASSEGVDEFVDHGEEGETTEEDSDLEESEVGLAERAVLVGRKKPIVVETDVSSRSSKSTPEPTLNAAKSKESLKDNDPETVELSSSPRPTHISIADAPAPESPRNRPIRRPSIASSHRSSIRSFPLDEVARRQAEREGVSLLEPEEHVHPVKVKTPAQEYSEAIVAKMLDPNKGTAVDAVAEEEEEKKKEKGLKDEVADQVDEIEEIENVDKVEKAETANEDELAKTDAAREPEVEAPKAEEAKPEDDKAEAPKAEQVSVEPSSEAKPEEEEPEEDDESYLGRRYTAEEKGKARMIEMVDGGVQTSDNEAESDDVDKIVTPLPGSPQRYTSLLPPVDAASFPSGPVSPALRPGSPGSELTPPPTPALEFPKSRIPLPARKRANSALSEISRTSKELSKPKAPSIVSTDKEAAPVTPRRRPTLRTLATDSRLSWLAGKQEGLKFDADGKPIDPEPHRKRPMSFVGLVKKVKEQQNHDGTSIQESAAEEETPSKNPSEIVMDPDVISVASSLKVERQPSKSDKRRSGIFHFNLKKEQESEGSSAAVHASTPEQEEKKPAFFRRRGTLSGGERPKSMFVSSSDAAAIESELSSPVDKAADVPESPSPRRRRGTMTGLARPLSMFVSDKDAQALQLAGQDAEKSPVQKTEEPESPFPRPRRRGTISGLVRPKSMFVSDKEVPVIASPEPANGNAGKKAEEKKSDDGETPHPKPRRRGTMSGIARPLSMLIPNKDAPVIVSPEPANGDVEKKSDEKKPEKKSDEAEPPHPKPRRRGTMSGIARPLSMLISDKDAPVIDATSPSTPKADDSKDVDAAEKEKKPFFKRRPTMSGKSRPVSTVFGSENAPAPSPQDTTPSESPAPETKTAPSIAESEKEKKPFFRRRPTMSGMSRPTSIFGLPKSHDSPATPDAVTPQTTQTPSRTPSIAESEKKPGLFRRRPTMSGAARPVTVGSNPATPADAISIASSHHSQEPKRGLFRRSTTLSTNGLRRPAASSGPSGAATPVLTADNISVTESAASSSKKPGLFRKSVSSDATPTAKGKMRGLVRAATFMGSSKKKNGEK